MTLIDLIRSAGRRGFFHLFGANFLTQVIGFAAQMFLAGILSPLEIGRIKILQTYTSTAAIAGKAGLDSSVLKLCSEVRTEDEKRRLFSAGFVGTALASLVTLTILLVLNQWGALSSDLDVRSLFWVYLTVLPLQTLAEVTIIYYQARQEFRIVSMIQIVSRSLNFVLIIVATYFLGIQGYVWAIVAGAAGVLVWLAVRSRDHFRSAALAQTRHDLGAHVHLAKFSVAANLTYQVLAYLEFFFLNYLVTDRTEIGYYGFAMTLLIPFLTITGTLQQWMMPRLSAVSHSADEWFSLYRQYHRWVMWGAFGLTVVAALLVPTALHLVFGDKFGPSGPLFQWLVAGWAIRMFYMTRGIALWGLGEIRLNFYAVLAALPVNAAITYALVSMNGTTGAAYANVGSQVVLAAISTWVFSNVIRKRITHAHSQPPIGG